MEILLCVVFVATIGIAALAAITWERSSVGERIAALGTVAVCLAATALLAHFLGSITTPWVALKIAEPLKTGATYRLVGSHQTNDEKYLLVILTEDGSYRTLKASELPPPHFIVGRDNELVALKE